MHARVIHVLRPLGVAVGHSFSRRGVFYAYAGPSCPRRPLDVRLGFEIGGTYEDSTAIQGLRRLAEMGARVGGLTCTFSEKGM